MAHDTRERFLDKAEVLFAERGFYGVSIAAIATELQLTKQALLHHFGSKEKLYGEVLQRISNRYEALYLDVDEIAGPAEKLKSYFLHLQNSSIRNGAQTSLLVRELLDNKQRADTAKNWYLKGFLQQLIDMVKSVPNWQSAEDVEVLALIYQLLGAINYYSISGPTLTNIFGPKMSLQLGTRFPVQLEHLVDAALSSR